MTFFHLIMALNVAWFGAGFWYFALKRNTAVKLLVPRSARESPIYPSFAAALPFLGGMNFALAALSALLLINPDLFVQTSEQVVFLCAFALAHASQFVVNVPIARNGGRIGESYWDVLRGPMLFIFVVDALMMVINAGYACFLLLN